MDKAIADVNDVHAFWDARPCNIRHSTAEIGTRTYFEEVQQRKHFVEPHIPGFAQFDRWKNKKVLEIGCGIGTAAVCFAQAGADYTAIELSEKSLQLTKQRFDLYDLEGELYLGNAEQLSSIVPVETYDLIYSFGVIHHTPRPQQIIDSVAQYMDDRSEFRLMLYAKNSWKNMMIETGIDQPEAQSGCPIALTYSQDEIRELLQDYEILDIHQDHIFPYVVEKYIRYEYQREPWFAAMSDEMFRALEKSLGWHTLVRCKLQS